MELQFYRLLAAFHLTIPLNFIPKVNKSQFAGNFFEQFFVSDKIDCFLNDLTIDRSIDWLIDWWSIDWLIDWSLSTFLVDSHVRTMDVAAVSCRQVPYWLLTVSLTALYLGILLIDVMAIHIFFLCDFVSCLESRDAKIWRSSTKTVIPLLKSPWRHRALRLPPAGWAVALVRTRRRPWKRRSIRTLTRHSTFPPMSRPIFQPLKSKSPSGMSHRAFGAICSSAKFAYRCKHWI